MVLDGCLAIRWSRTHDHFILLKDRGPVAIPAIDVLTKYPTVAGLDSFLIIRMLMIQFTSTLHGEEPARLLELGESCVAGGNLAVMLFEVTVQYVNVSYGSQAVIANVQGDHVDGFQDPRDSKTVLKKLFTLLQIFEL
jgi:hypothetical protein